MCWLGREDKDLVSHCFFSLNKFRLDRQLLRMSQLGSNNLLDMIHHLVTYLWVLQS
jgi:hypothetical protein